jgi:N-acetyl sugar amidotransferase
VSRSSADSDPRPGGRAYRQCTVSVLDTNDDPAIRFDEQGRSHYYHEYNSVARERLHPGEDGQLRLERLANRIRADGQGKKYDSILGLSGGVDSTYVTLLAKKLGLNPLAVHLDNGWDSELAVQNIENTVQRLNLDLFTHVINWEEFRDLQVAYLRASVVDIEVITDHAIFATLYRTAARHGIRHILSGTNVVTEQVLPPHWIHAKTDHVNIKAIHRAYGAVPLKTYPFMDLRVKKIHQIVRGIRNYSVLDYVDYDKATVKQLIARELGWRDYGGKHYESIFTRFYQGYILPRKFGIDKRKAHLSNLIFAGQITKEEALKILADPPYEPDLLAADYTFVLKKLRLSGAEFEELMSLPAKSHSDYDVEKSIYASMPILGVFRRPMGIINQHLLRRRAL